MREKTRAAVDALGRAGTRPRFVPIDLASEAEVRAALDVDLASLVENRLGPKVDGVSVSPAAIDEGRRREWIARATVDGRQSAFDPELTWPCWLVVENERIGTLAIWPPWSGERALVTSFYVQPEHRGRGLGGRALTSLIDALGQHGIGVRLETEWAWQRAVRFYLDRGLWVRSWKRDLQLIGDTRLPRAEVEFEGEDATLSATIDGQKTSLIQARREGDRLAWNPLLADAGELRWLAPGTMALHTAVRGWPLITSDEDWQNQLDLGFSDAGGPNGLAFRIQRWEGLAMERGWLNRTPRIPGLDYPTWEELRAR